jgi:hypothetical protein
MESESGSLFLARLAPKGGKPQLFVIEQYPGVATATDRVQFVREATRISTLIHANLPRIRELRTRGDDLVVVRSYVDGARLSAVWPNVPGEGCRLPLDATLRVLIDMLGALGALHNLSDDKQPPLRIVHGEVCPANVLMGFDGASRLLRAIGRRAPGARLASESLRYVAPELLTEGTADCRADVYSMGALLWEALSGKPLMVESDGIEILERARAGHPPATVSEETPWAKPLISVAARALEANPNDRFPSAMALGAEIRRVAGVKIATIPATGSAIVAAVGERDPARGAVLKGEALEAPQAGSPSPPAPADATPPPTPTVVTPPPAPTVATAPPGLMRSLAPPFPQRSGAPPPPLPRAASAPAAQDFSSVELIPDSEPMSVQPASEDPPSLRSLASMTPTLRPESAGPAPAKPTLEIVPDGPPTPRDPPTPPPARHPPVAAATPRPMDAPLPAPMPVDLPAMPGLMFQAEPKNVVRLPPGRSRMVTLPSIRVRQTRRSRLIKVGGIAAVLALGAVAFWVLSPRSEMFRALGQTTATDKVATPRSASAPPVPAAPPVTEAPLVNAAPPATGAISAATAETPSAVAPTTASPSETTAPAAPSAPPRPVVPPQRAPPTTSTPEMTAAPPASPSPKPATPRPPAMAKPKAPPAQKPEAVFHPGGL